ncbi:hypothetical protein KP509_1Z225500 [Ceratopteris richardii]|nr:hypothetical protein KP509_1Z225500 [Ceratopteris richardii]
MEMNNRWLLTMPSLICSDRLQCFSGAPVKYICYTHNNLKPETMWKSLTLDYTPFHLHESHVLSFNNSIVLRCILHSTLEFYPMFNQKCIKIKRHIYPPSIRTEGAHLTCSHIFSQNQKLFNAHEYFGLCFQWIYPCVPGKIIKENHKVKIISKRGCLSRTTNITVNKLQFLSSLN